MLNAAIVCRNHASAQAPNTACCLREEAMEKAPGLCLHHQLGGRGSGPAPKPQKTLLAAVPHESQSTAPSFQLHISKLKLTSINGMTNPCSLHQLMDQMGKFSHICSTKSPIPTQPLSTSISPIGTSWLLAIDGVHGKCMALLLCTPQTTKQDDPTKLVVPT